MSSVSSFPSSSSGAGGSSRRSPAAAAMAFFKSSSEASRGTATVPLGPSSGESRQLKATVSIGALVLLLAVPAALLLDAPRLAVGGATRK